ncbi:MAG: hypothetical protein MJZ66_10080 [Bacteroidales bacterium]|nr:hypothetical protein [Bacteroidales bacterium]
MKKVLFMILLLVVSQAVFGQRRAHRDSLRQAERHRMDTAAIAAESDTSALPIDSLALETRKPKSIVDYPIAYQCSDSMMVNFDDKLVFLYGKSNVKAEQMELSSDHMRIEMDNSSIFAEGREDTITHEISDEPKFKDGRDEFTARIMKYNFKTKKGHVLDVLTEQNNGFLHGQITKMHPDRQIHFKGGQYTTCDLDHPHFYLQLTRAKMLPNDKIISGPAYFVFLDVPVFALGLPFGIFPNSKKTANGVVIPKYGEESRRGFYLEDGGYYFAFGDYADLELLGTVYSRGSWGLRASSKFKVRYKFSGGFDFQFSRNVSGLKEFGDSRIGDLKYSPTNSYMLKFNFNQDAKANPYSNFGINIQYDKQSFDKYNARSVQDYAKSNTSSSISYQRRMFNGKANLSLSGNLNQNLSDSTVSFTAPNLSFSVNRFFPFKRKMQVGAQKWYEKIGSSFNLNFENRVAKMADSLLFTSKMVDNMRYGLKYSMPVSTSFNLFKYIQVSPSIQYTGRVYPNYVSRHAMNTYTFDGLADTLLSKYSYEQDTINAIRHCFDFSTSVSASTKLYGIFQFNRAKRIKAFRHVLTPTVGLSWRPDFSEEFWRFYRTDPTDETKTYSIYQNGIYGAPSPGKSASLSFGLGNNFELKVKGKNDTIDGQYTKIKLLENLSFSSGYNMAADSMKFSTISMSGSTRLFDKMNVTFSGNFDPYQLNDSTGQRINKFEISNGRLARLTNASISTGFTLNSKTLSKKKLDEKEKAAQEFGDMEAEAEVDDEGNIVATAEEVEEKRKKESKVSDKERNGEFDYYSVPWNLTASYSFNYNHSSNKPATVRQTLSLSGSVTFTDKWSMTVRTGYDFDAKKMTSTTISVTRDLHCFDLSFYIIPFGKLKSYNFTLAINSSMFQGIEYKRTQSWHDN